MTKKATYASARAFRMALETRINDIAKKSGHDLQRIRRQISYDRLLARLFLKKPSPWLLKGGYAMQLRVSNARATRDVDLAMKSVAMEPDEDQGLALLGILNEHASQRLEDFFEFVISGPIDDLDAAPYGGARFLVEARLENRTFEKFQLDVGIGDAWIEPSETLTGSEWLDFAGFPAQTFPAISREQQFAEKIHAYTLPRGEGVTNSRVKDLVDMCLLISQGTLARDNLKKAIQLTFEKRATHSFNSDVSPPPENWAGPFAKLASECSISTDMEAAFQTLREFLKRL